MITIIILISIIYIYTYNIYTIYWLILFQKNFKLFTHKWKTYSNWILINTALLYYISISRSRNFVVFSERLISVLSRSCSFFFLSRRGGARDRDWRMNLWRRFAAIHAVSRFFPRSRNRSLELSAACSHQRWSNASATPRFPVPRW